MAVTQYVGARYVPIFADPLEWTNTKQYEPLTIVLHEGNSYTSRQFVPVGVNITNSDYWVETGNYNAQVESYRQDVVRLDAIIPSSDFDSENTVKDYIDEIDDTLKTKTIEFDTVTEMRTSESLYPNALCHTLGYDNINDGGAFYWLVSESATPNAVDVVTLQNGLYATAINMHNGDSVEGANEETINALIQVGASYVAQGTNLTYGIPEGTTLWSNMKISCSTLSILTIMGVPFEVSPYVIEASPNTRFSSLYGGYGYPLFDRRGDYVHGSARLAIKAAKSGHGFYPNADYSNLRPGDILFFKNADSSGSQGWLDIAHCEVFVGYRSSTARAAGTPEHIIVVSGGSTSGQPVRFYDRNLESGQILVYCARYNINGSGLSVPVGIQPTHTDKHVLSTVTMPDAFRYSLGVVSLELDLDTSSQDDATVKVIIGGVPVTYRLNQDTKRQKLVFMNVFTDETRKTIVVETSTNVTIVRAAYSSNGLCSLNDDCPYVSDANTPEAFIEDLKSRYVLTTGPHYVRLPTVGVVPSQSGNFMMYYSAITKNFELMRIGETRNNAYMIFKYIYNYETQTYSIYRGQVTLSAI